MKNVISLLILFLISYFGISNASAGYIGVAGNYNSFANDPMEEYKSKMLGPSFELTIGFNNKGTSFELFNKRSSMAGDVNLEGETIEIGQKENTFGFKFNFFITPKIYLIVGYATHEITNTVETESALLKAGVESVFNLDEGPYRSDGPILGAGVMLYTGSKVGLALDYNRTQYTSREAVNQAISLNMKFNVDLSFGSFR